MLSWCGWRLVAVVLWAVAASAAGGHENAASKGAANPLVQQLERSLLSMFGLQRRPRVKRDMVVPPYMLEMYRLHSAMDAMEPHEDHQAPQAPQAPQAIVLPQDLHYPANTIRSFVHTESGGDVRYPGHKMRLRFNVTGIPAEERLQWAELRLNHARHPDAPALPPEAVRGTREPSKSGRVSGKRWSRGDVPYLQRMLVYDVVRLASSTSDPALRLLDTTLVDSRDEGVQSLDVSDAVARWLREPRTNYGLLVEVVPFKHKAATDASHIRLRRSAADGKWHEKQPLLVLHTSDGRTKTRQRRSTLGKHKKGKQRCKRHNMYVDFRKVGWDDWIVAPAGYEAYFCMGDCPFPLNDHMNATNHAVVQTLVNSRYPDRVPKACCVPTELSAISMLYMDEDERFVLKNHQDMVVEACGCR